MKHYRSQENGIVFAYEDEEERQVWGAADLVEMTEGEVAAYVASQVAVAPAVPPIVTMRQARLALLGAGLLAQVDAAIDALASPQKEAARIEWEYSQEVHRDRPFVALLGAGMGLSEQQLDDLFTLAATL